MIEPQYPTPMALVEALQQRGRGARAQLWHWLRDPFNRLMRQLSERYRFEATQDRATQHALHLAEAFLRTRPASDYQSQSWAAFRAALLLQIGKIAFQPFDRQIGVRHDPEPLPECATYQNRTLFLPHERVGDRQFGGDWFGGIRGEDGALWVIVADVTGHGYAAYLLASALPAVWHKCWETSRCLTPTDLLASMHNLLEDCLPDGVFVECTLAWLSSTGDVTIAPAGGTRFLVRRSGRVDLVKLRGGWLGLLPPSAKDQHRLTLAIGDELLLGSDGFFDQLDEAATRDLQRGSNFRGLFELATELLRQSLEQKPAGDDITLVQLRRVDGEQTTPLPYPGTAEQRGGGPVSV